jgi:hypothetical protein
MPILKHEYLNALREQKEPISNKMLQQYLIEQGYSKLYACQIIQVAEACVNTDLVTRETRDDTYFYSFKTH